MSDFAGGDAPNLAGLFGAGPPPDVNVKGVVVRPGGPQRDDKTEPHQGPTAAPTSRDGDSRGEIPGSTDSESPHAIPGEDNGDSDGHGYTPYEEARLAGESLVEILGEVRGEVRSLIAMNGPQIAQTPELPEAVDRLAGAVDALTRTVEALTKEVKAGRGGGSLPVVALMQKSAADSAAEDAESKAPEGRVRKMLREIMRRLDGAGAWLWSMIVHLTTIREWSLGGKLKVPGFAEASLTVTFGGNRAPAH